jgi:hypothetical protein
MLKWRLKMIVCSKPIYGLALPTSRRKLFARYTATKGKSSFSPSGERSFDSGKLPLLKSNAQALRLIGQTIDTSLDARRKTSSRLKRKALLRGTSVKPISRRINSLKAHETKRKEAEPVNIESTLRGEQMTHLSPIASCEHLHFCPSQPISKPNTLPKTPKLPSKPTHVRLWALVQEDL